MPSVPRRVSIIVLLAMAALSPETAAAQLSADQVLARMDELQRRNKSESAVIEMRLFDGDKEVQRRELTVQSRTDDNDQTSAFVEFTSPPDIRGLRLLTVQTGDDDDQRIYLPALRRVQRIAGSSREDRFAGSDLSYEDLRVRDRDDYASRMVDSTDNAWTIESDPKDDESPYSRIVAEIDKVMYAVTRARYFDKKGRLTKILTASDFERYGSDVWKASTITMEDVREDRRTELVYRERDLDTEISPDVFSDRYLRRGVQ